MNVIIQMKSYFPLQPTFFGLSDKYIEDVYEQFFTLKYYGSWSFTEAYNLPIKLREWFVHRLVKQKQDENEAAETATGEGGHTTTQLGPGVKPPAL
jgi:hypothetical protein